MRGDQGSQLSLRVPQAPLADCPGRVAAGQREHPVEDGARRPATATGSANPLYWRKSSALASTARSAASAARSDTVYSCPVAAARSQPCSTISAMMSAPTSAAGVLAPITSSSRSQTAGSAQAASARSSCAR